MPDESVQPLTKPVVARQYLFIMNSSDAWVFLDWSAHPSAKQADLLVLPPAEVAKKHSL